MASPQTHVTPEHKEVYFVCRLGNDSQLAVDAVGGLGGGLVAKDLIGGLRAWAASVDPDFPVY